MPTELDTICDDFTFLDEWEDRYRYVIDLGRELPDLPETARSDANKVRGCVSQVWLQTNIEPSTNPPDSILRFLGDSDALIVRGLIAILFAVYNGRTARQIVETDALALFTELGLKEHLTPQRSNGLSSMVARVRRDAELAAVG